MPTPNLATFDLGVTIIGLAGGLVLFLFGLEQMTEALRTIAGGRMKNLLAKATGNRFKGATTGAVVTAIIQSSSATTVLVVGFISAGLISLSQAIPLIMGANVGTTITAQVIAFKITKYAMILVIVGYGVMFFGRRQRTQGYGKMAMGLGLIFFGMQLMGDATNPLRSHEPFINLMKSLDNAWLAALMGMAFTALVQSSSATTGVVIVLAGQGFITLEAGIALALGANVGTCVTAMLASIGKPTEAVQGAVVHVIFNIIGVLIWIGLIDQLAAFVRAVSPTATELAGVEKLAAEVPRQVANAHTFFNIINTVLFIGFTRQMAAVVQRLVPHRPKSTKDSIQPKYLDDVLLKTPALALDRARLEIGRLGRLVIDMVNKVPSVVLYGTPEEIEQLKNMDRDVDSLHASIIHYLGRLSMENIDERQSELLHDFFGASNYIENIGDMVETNLVEVAEERFSNRVYVSNSTEKQFHALHDRVVNSITQAINSLAEHDRELAGLVIGNKEIINQLADQAELHLTQRLVVDEPNRLHAFRVESDLMENIKRMYYFAKRIAKIVAKSDVLPAEQSSDTDGESGSIVVEPDSPRAEYL